MWKRNGRDLEIFARIYEIPPYWGRFRDIDLFLSQICIGVCGWERFYYILLCYIFYFYF
jgi:hypothetical protein